MWWDNAVGYEVYLPSFCDGNGDGWGDLPGLVSKLDYLVELGVDLLWVTPFYVSPMHDHGYDIADYREVDPRFGTLADLDRLIAEAGERGMRVISDLVVNHTSNEHPWFRRSRADRDGPYRDYYLWRPGRAGGPPNNWVATFGGSAWTHDPATDEWYVHLFTPEQPDLNWSNPKVADEVESIMRYWLDRGLAGFRVDTAHYLAKHPDLPDNPPLPAEAVRVIGGAVADWYRYDHRHDIGQPALRDIHRRWRMLADDYDAFLVGETHILDPGLLAGYLDDTCGLHSYFYFGLVQSEVDSGATEGDLLRAASTTSPRLSWTQSSHDWARAATRYGAERALALTTLTLGLPGTTFLYQGDELGLTNGRVPPEEARDPLAARGGNHTHNRDAARTPMPWEPTPGLGFTSAERAWLPFGGRVPADTVAVQDVEAGSMLNRHRELLRLHRSLPWREPVRWLDAPAGVTAYRRGDVMVAANLGPRPAPLELGGGWRTAFASRSGDGRILAPDEAVVLRRQ
jgi:alpha-glucosidase